MIPGKIAIVAKAPCLALVTCVDRCLIVLRKGFHFLRIDRLVVAEEVIVLLGDRRVGHGVFGQRVADTNPPASCQ